MSTLKLPSVDLEAVRSGEHAAMVTAIAETAARWFSMADSHISFQHHASHVAREEGTAKAGLLAAAMDLRELLTESDAGRQALSRFGFEFEAKARAEPVGIDALGMPIFPQASALEASHG